MNRKMRYGGTVEQLDVNRYMGKWYEIARFDHRFERGMSRVTAEYVLRSPQKIDVVNSGYRKGEYHSAHGHAVIPDLADPGKLRVSFFLFFYNDYFVLELDPEDYSYALIGSSSGKYLWILSRTPRLSPEILSLLLTKARMRGYDTTKLLFTEQ